MKLEKLDHKHALTSWLKVILFACLMLAPIMSVVVRSLYVVCNKNAKDSYSDTNFIETQAKVTSKIDIADNSLLTYTKDRQLNGYSALFPFKSTTLDLTSLFGNANITQIGVYTDSDLTNNYIVGVPNDNYTQRQLILNNNITSFSFVYDASGTTYYDTTYTSSFSLYITTYQPQKMDNVFDYSISQIKQSQFYNWTQNTAIYNGVEAMTTGLGITGATVPILITYWFLLTIIYIVIDIILNLFTYITHYLNKKVE